MKQMIKNAKASLAALLALLLLVGMLPMGMLTTTAAKDNNIVLQEDFESGDLSDWIISGAMDASIKPGIGTDFSKGLAINEGSGKWHSIRRNFTAEGGAYYEIDFDYYESTVSQTVQLVVRSDEAESYYTTGRMESTQGQWKHYNATFYIEEFETTNQRLVIITDGEMPANDKAFDNIVIRKVEESVEYGKTIFEDDFENGNLDQWTLADGMVASVNAGVGKDFSKGLKINEGAGKWSTVTHYFTVELNKYYEISFDYYESTDVETVQVQIRYQGSSDKLYNSEPLESTKGQWVHYSGTFRTEDLTDLRLLIVTDGIIPSNDKAFDNFVIREVKQSTVYGETAFEDDFENSEAGTTGRWENAQSSTGAINEGVGTNFSKGMVANGPKWSRIRRSITLKANTCYEISYDYYESTTTVTSGVMVRAKNQDPIVDVYASEKHSNTKGLWVHYSEIFYTEEFTTYWLMVQFDADTMNSDKTYDNFVIREVLDLGDLPDEPEDPGLVFANGDFETGDFSSWESGNSMSVITEDVHGGSYAARVAGGLWASLAQWVDVTPNTDYRFTYWVRFEEGSGAHTTYVMNGAGTTNMYAFNVRPKKADGWVKYEHIINSGDETKIQLKFCVSNEKAVFVYDDATFAPLGAVDFDGYLYNGSFETGDKSKWEGGGAFDIITDAYDGSYAIHVKGDNYANIGQPVPTEANTEYSVIVWAKKASGNGKFAILYKDKNQTKNIESFYIDATDEWARYAVTFNTGEYANGHILIMADGTVNTAYVDAISMVKGKPVTKNGLIVNGDFESGDLSAWENVGSESEVVNTDQQDGEYALLLKGKQWSAVRQTIETVKNTDYVITFYAKRVSGFNQIAVWLKDGDKNLVDPAGAEIGLKFNIAASEGWVKYEHIFKSYDQNKVDVLFGMMENGDEVLIDGIHVEKYTKPDVQPLQLTSFGENNNRPRNEAANLIINGGFESNEGAQWNTTSFLGTNVSILQSKDAREGNRMLYFNTSSTNTDVKYVFWVSVEPNTNYTFSAFVKGAYWSATNQCAATFGVIDPDTENFMIYPGERGKNSKADYQLVPTAWDNEWHLRSVSFNSGDKKLVGIAVYGSGSQMYLDSLALYKNTESAKYTDPRNISMITTNIDAVYAGCAPEDNLVGNFNMEANTDDFWSTGYGWKNDFIGIYESETGYRNSLQYVGSANPVGVRYIKWIDVKPNTNYTFSANLLVQADGDGCLELLDSKTTKPSPFVMLSFQTEVFGEDWVQYCLNFNTGVYDRIGICLLDKGGQALIDNIRIFETAKGIEVEDEYLQNGWVEKNDKWYYYENNTMVKSTWKKDSIGWCYLGDQGYMLTDKWVKDSVGWCYVGADGYCVTNKWVADSKGWCYLDGSGRMVTNKWIQDSVGWCYVGADGYCITNKWVADSKGWCYLDENGRMATNKWVKDSKGWCYVGADGYCVTNKWVADSQGWCYLDANGRMVTNKWIKDSVGWCYIGASGYCVTDEWIQDSTGGWCYLDSNGRMVYNTWVAGNYVDANGYWVIEMSNL